MKPSEGRLSNVEVAMIFRHRSEEWVLSHALCSNLSTAKTWRQAKLSATHLIASAGTGRSAVLAHTQGIAGGLLVTGPATCQRVCSCWVAVIGDHRFPTAAVPLSAVRTRSESHLGCPRATALCMQQRSKTYSEEAATSRAGRRLTELQVVLAEQAPTYWGALSVRSQVSYESAPPVHVT